jgi:hypothetical protein
MTIAAMTPQYARAQDDINLANDFNDNDVFIQENGASISQSESASQTAENSASANSFDGGPSTITQEIEQNQQAQIGQSNIVEDSSRRCRCKHPTNKTLGIQVRYL